MEISSHNLPGELYPQEQACIQNAIAKRQKEFAAGRLAARMILREWDIDNFPLVMGPKREPLWPEGITGSITHTKDYCGVAIARTQDMRSLGVDAERVGRLKAATWDTIFRPEEKRWLNQQPLAQQSACATVLFSAKEAVFKCQYPLTHSYVGFQDVEVRVDQTRKTFTATFQKDITQEFHEGFNLEGTYAQNNDILVAAVFMENHKSQNP